jgi:hypothetical protein
MLRLQVKSRGKSLVTLKNARNRTESKVREAVQRLLLFRIFVSAWAKLRLQPRLDGLQQLEANGFLAPDETTKYR